MTSIIYETENGVFYFDKTESVECLNQYLSSHKLEDAAKILEFISNSQDDPIRLPDNFDWFGYIAMYLTNEGKGSVNCKICQVSFIFRA